MDIAFKAEVWQYDGPAAWHFITLPTHIAREIDERYGHLRKGWGSLPVQVTIGQTTWSTSIFSDKQAGSYLLPLKAAVRKQEQIQAADQVKVFLSVAL